MKSVPFSLTDEQQMRLIQYFQERYFQKYGNRETIPPDVLAELQQVVSAILSGHIPVRLRFLKNFLDDLCSRLPGLYAAVAKYRHRERSLPTVVGWIIQADFFFATILAQGLRKVHVYDIEKDGKLIGRLFTDKPALLSICRTVFSRIFDIERRSHSDEVMSRLSERPRVYIDEAITAPEKDGLYVYTVKDAEDGLIYGCFPSENDAIEFCIEHDLELV